jgi:opacity protein-like surface antigen
MLLAVVPVAAQSAAPANITPQVEVALGYTYVRARTVVAGGCCFNMNGGSVSAAVGVNRWLSLVGDVGGYYSGNVQDSGNTLSVFPFIFGPRFTYRRSERFTPFAQALFGGGHAGGTLYTRTFRQGSAPPSARNAFAMAVGGGLDVNLSQHFAIRAFQADWFFTEFPNGVTNHQHNLRLSAGVVFRFGKR